MFFFPKALEVCLGLVRVGEENGDARTGEVFFDSKALGVCCDLVGLQDSDGGSKRAKAGKEGSGVRHIDPQQPPNIIWCR